MRTTKRSARLLIVPVLAIFAAIGAGSLAFARDAGPELEPQCRVTGWTDWTITRPIFDCRRPGHAPRLPVR